MAPVADRLRLLSLVVPVYNEEAVLPVTVPRLRTIADSLGSAWEMIFVNDGSRDGSLELLEAEADRDHRMKVLSFSRNFGHQAAVTAGLDCALGDAVVVMDADLQDPPELLPEMVELYRQGYDVVSPQRAARRTDTLFKRWTASMFYRLLGSFSDTPIPADVGDFRLLSAEAAAAMRQLREQHRFVRGMVAWLGFKEAFVPFERQARAAGKTKYPLRKMLQFSWVAITSFSAAPLRMTMTMGGTAVFFALCYLLYAAYQALIRHAVVIGWTSMVFLQCFFFGVTLICVGLIGEYVARIYEETKGRPLYVVNRIRNMEPPRLERSIFITARDSRSVRLEPKHTVSELKATDDVLR